LNDLWLLANGENMGFIEYQMILVFGFVVTSFFLVGSRLIKHGEW